MALVLRIKNIDEFYAMTHFARQPYYKLLHFQCTPTEFTLTVSRPSHQGCCFIELRFQPQFFPHYTTTTDNIILHRLISPNQFFASFSQMSRCRFDYLLLILGHLFHSLKLSFCNNSDPPGLSYDLCFPFLPTNQHLDLNRIHSTTFVIFPSIILQSLLASAKSQVALIVSLTTSLAKFTRKDIGRNVGYVLSAERRECSIQGVAEGEEIRFIIVLDPIESFNDILKMSNTRNLVGIGRLNNNRGLIVIRVGLYAQYVSYSS